jgi:hypothetical protein
MSGTQSSPALDNPTKEERRSWNRFPVQVEVLCQKTPSEDEMRWPARVTDISRSGMRVVSPHKFEPTTVIRISKADGAKGSSEFMEALVVRAHRSPGEKWTLGCALINELSEAELLAWFDKNCQAS